MNGLIVRFLEAVTALHIARVSRAVFDGKHMAGFVSCEFTSPLQASAERLGVARGITEARE